jgi:Protein kinase domain
MIETNTIPGYRVIRQLGQGGSATTYLAIQLSFERQVALKVMSPTLNADPTFAMRFVREARIVAQMHHASIVPVFDVGEHRPYHYLSMEYLPGGDLRQRIVEGRSSLALALDVCMALCSALEVAHRKGFVHRDIKPQNILFREDGAPVLTDFGIARAIDVGTSLTVAGMFVGTPAYMSPEQVKGTDLDARTDLYSLGMVFYEMLTGNVPFRVDSDSALSIAMKHLNETLPPLPLEFARYQPIVDRLTAKDRNQRYASATEVLHALRAMSEGEGSRASTLVRTAARATETTIAAAPTATVAVSRNADQKRWLPWAAAFVVVGALGAGAGVYSGRQKPSPAIASIANDATAQIDQEPEAVMQALPTGAGIADATDSLSPAPAAEVESMPAVSQPAATVASIAPPVSPSIERPRETAEAIRERRIRTLLNQAQQDVERGALASPPKENAAERYRQVLELDPANADARTGLQGLSTRLEEIVDRTRRSNELDEAQAALDQLRLIEPAHPRIAKLQADIADRKVTLAKRGRRAQENALEHVKRAEQSLERSPLVVRAVADAHDHYEAAMKLEPETAGLAAMKERIVAGYVTAAQYELNRNESKRALNVVNYARRRGVVTPELERIEGSANGAGRR